MGTRAAAVTWCRGTTPALWSVVDDLVDAAHQRSLTAARLIGREPGLAVQPSTWGETALQAASHMGNRELLCHLRAIGVELDLFAACVLGDRELIFARWRPGSGHALGVHFLPVLHFGIAGGDVGTVELLIRMGAALNPPFASLSPVHSAVAHGSERMVSCLVAAGAELSARDGYGDTAHDWARRLDGPGSRMLELVEPA